ncbi:hypothetical protein [Oecophyllibacter saccharovorans]|uniref:DUF4234 domain-containing protein n=1 Tax=Oecophyllibacter saccharovorans TaxID=2558360 RepID=A0A506URR3_9PROT|nr:hypothetical protein [Oecophyllibacter saccharovorans]TPW36041.1 hypothetical protein E3202_03840 [Oecophyllibacter saccharovorans]
MTPTQKSFLAVPEEDRMSTILFLVLTFFSGGIFYYVRLSQILILCRNRFEPFPYKGLFYSLLILAGAISTLSGTLSSIWPTNAQFNATSLSADEKAQMILVLIFSLALVLTCISWWILQLLLAYRTARSLRLKADETYGIDLPINNFLIFLFSFYYLNYILNKYAPLRDFS